MKNDKALIWVTSNYSAAQTFRQPLETKWASYYKLWRAQSDDGAGTNTKDDAPSGAYRSKWQSALGTEIVETVLPKIINANIGFECLPQEEDDKDVSRLNNSLITWQQNKNRFDRFVRVMVKDALVYGSGMGKIVWGDKYPLLINVDIFDLFIDPAATCNDDARFIIHRTYSDPYELGDNPNYDKRVINRIIKEQEAEAETKYRAAGSGFSQKLQAQGLSSSQAKKPIEILECWGNYNGEAVLVVIANGQYVLRNDTNPFKHGKKPFIKIDCMDSPHDYYGRGLMEIVKPEVDRHSTLIRQFIDNAARVNNRGWAIRKGSGIKRADLVSKPNFVVEVNDLNSDLKEFPQQPLAIDFYKEEESIMGRIKNLVGLLDNNSPEVNKTATGMAILQETSNDRGRLMSKILEDDGLVPMGEMWVSLNAQFMKKPIVIRITGEQGQEWQEIKPGDIKDNFDIKVVSGSQLPQNVQARIMNFMAYYQPSVGNPIIDQFKLEQERADKFNMPADMIKEPQSVINTIGGSNGQSGGGASPIGVPGMEGAMQGPAPQAGMPSGEVGAGVGQPISG